MARSEQRDQIPFSDSEDWMPEQQANDSSEVEEAIIHKRVGIDPKKRRRIEMMQEERELRRSLREVFDDDS